MNNDKMRTYKGFQLLDLEEDDGLYPTVKVVATKVTYYEKKNDYASNKIRVGLTLDMENRATVAEFVEQLKRFLPPGKQLASLLSDDGRVHGDMLELDQQKARTRKNDTGKSVMSFLLEVRHINFGRPGDEAAFAKINPAVKPMFVELAKGKKGYDTGEGEDEEQEVEDSGMVATPKKRIITTDAFAAPPAPKKKNRRESKKKIAENVVANFDFLTQPDFFDDNASQMF